MVLLPRISRAFLVGLGTFALVALATAHVVLGSAPASAAPQPDAARSASLTRVAVFAGLADAEQSLVAGR